MQRRMFLKAVAASAPVAATVKSLSAFGTATKQTVRIVQFDASGVRTSVVEMEKVEKPEAESEVLMVWRVSRSCATTSQFVV